MKTFNAARILCPSALAAALLATILDSEGHACVWLTDDSGPQVLTMAPLSLVTAAIDTVSTALRMPRSVN